MAPRRAVLRWTVLLLLLVACAKPISRSEIDAARIRYYEATASYADVAAPEDFVHTAHRAGHPKEYATNVGSRRPLGSSPVDVNLLMDRCFDELGMTAIEVDLQPSPTAGSQDVIIAHDRIATRDLPADAQRYMARNTLTHVLDHFVEQGHHRRGRHLLLELKASYSDKQAGVLDPPTRELLARTAAALERFEASAAPDQPIRDSVAFLAFSLPALAELHAALGDGFGYFLMATSNRFPRFVFDWATPLPKFDDEVVAQLSGTPWISGTVFAPRFVSGFVGTMNDINRARRGRGFAPLEVHMAIYTSSFDDYVARLRDETRDGEERLEHAAGLVYELGRPQ